MDYIVLLDDKIVYLICDHGFVQLMFDSAEIAKEFNRFIEHK